MVSAGLQRIVLSDGTYGICTTGRAPAGAVAAAPGGIAQANELGAHRHHACRPVDGGEGHVLGVAPGGQAHHLFHRRHARGIEQHPAPTQVGFEDGMEIRRRLVEVRIRTDQPRRNVQCTAEGDGQVRVVAAYARALHEDIARRGGGVGRADAVGDVVVHPVADRTHARVAARQGAEQLLRHRAEQVRLAIASRQHEVQHLVGDLVHRYFARVQVDRIDDAVDDGPVPHPQRPGARAEAHEAVAGMFIGVGAVPHGRLEQQILFDQRLVHAQCGMDQEHEFAVAVEFVGQHAIDLRAHAGRRRQGRTGCVAKAGVWSSR